MELLQVDCASVSMCESIRVCKYKALGWTEIFLIGLKKKERII